MAPNRADPFPKRMRDAREAAGLSLINATFALRAFLPRAMWCSVESVRRLEKPTADETKADPVLIAGLASVYGVEVDDLSEWAANELKSVRDLLVRRLRWFTEHLASVG